MSSLIPTAELTTLTRENADPAFTSFRPAFFPFHLLRTSDESRQAQYDRTSHRSPPPVSGLAVLLIHDRAAVTVNAASIKLEVGVVRAISCSEVTDCTRRTDGVDGTCGCRAWTPVCIWLCQLRGGVPMWMGDDDTGKEGVDRAKSARMNWVELVSTSLDPLAVIDSPGSVGNTPTHIYLPSRFTRSTFHSSDHR